MPDQDQTDGDTFCADCAEPMLSTECCDQCGCCATCCECPNCGCERCSKIRAAAVGELRTIAAARRADDLADETIDGAMSWSAATLKSLVDQVATGSTGGDLTAVACHLATQVTTPLRAQVLLLMFAHGLDDLRKAVDVLSCRHGEPVQVLTLVRNYLEYHQGAALVDIALDGS